MGRKTEIEFLNEAVVKRAEKLGLDTPVNRKISALIHNLERGDSVTLEQLY
jgi:2-dehydropantoate 2-reductase